MKKQTKEQTKIPLCSTKFCPLPGCYPKRLTKHLGSNAITAQRCQKSQVLPTDGASDGHSGLQSPCVSYSTHAVTFLGHVIKRSIKSFLLNVHFLSLHSAATWTYVMYLTVQTSLHWISGNSVTEVKIVEFNESNSPCFAFAFYDIISDQLLRKCPSDWKIYLENGECFTIRL